MDLAPVAAFVYKRPEHTRAMFASLCANPEVARTPVYVFCDGPRSSAEVDAVAATRDAVKQAGIDRLVMVEQEENRGLGASIIAGVSQVCRQHGRVIAIEDDLVLAPSFLEYMNAALERYREAANVHAISGFMYPVSVPRGVDALFMPFITSWGWATWQRAWSAFDEAATGHPFIERSWRMRHRFDLGGSYPYCELLNAQRRGVTDSWAVRWYLSVFQRGGLSLFPARSLVENRGFGSGATNCDMAPLRSVRSEARAFRVERWPEPRVNEVVFRRTRRLLARDHGLVAQAANRCYRWIREMTSRGGRSRSPSR